MAVVSGKKGGPTVWVNASIHGDEYLGTAAIARLLPSLEPEALTGSLILTPVLNVPAFREMRRTNSHHDVDLNRAWAGGVHPGMTTRIRDEVASEILARADVVIDLHSGGNRYLQGAFTVYHRVGGTVEGRSCALAKACGLPLIWADGTEFLEGALITAAAKMGKPSALIEIAGEGKVEEHWVLRMVSAVRGALARAGVLRWEPDYLPEYRVFHDFSLVRNHREGLWERQVEPGEDVGKGDTLGRILDPFGAEIEVVKSTEDANLLGIYTYGFVTEGETIAELGHGFHKEGPPA
ncbi:MAG: succinylglutamate desuccinylase/aspartoacylase family protein [Candidatus Thermoplasmatota archaeon]